MILVLSWLLIDLGPLGLDEEIYNARAPCTWLVHVLRLQEYRLSNKSSPLELGDLPNSAAQLKSNHRFVDLFSPQPID